MTLGVPIIELILLRRRSLGKEDPNRMKERRGVTELVRPGGNLIWLHASSVGESIAALVLIEKLLETQSADNILITTGTLTSSKLLKKRLPKRAIHQFVPIDRPAWVQRFLNHWRPNLVLIMESEFWPTQIRQIKKRNIPIITINARLSKSSYSRWRWANSMARSVFGSLELVIATNTQQAKRFSNLGAKHVQVAGNLKRSARKLPLEVEAANKILKQIGTRKVWLAASTHEGEDLSIINAQKQLHPKFPDLLTIIVPRHPKRGYDIEALAQENGLSVTRRSSNEEIKPGVDLYIADTLGELSIFFEIAQYVFVAGSLVPVGGHNPIEPAHFNCTIFFGPLMAKNQEVATEMVEQQAALQIDSIHDLSQTLEKLFSDSDLSQALSCRAQAYAASGDDILETILTALNPYIKNLQ